jgi:hypothetical protein
MSADPLATLQRAIAAQQAAPVYAQDALWARLMRLTAPVLDERDQLLTFLERAWQHTNQHPDLPDREKRDGIWIARLQRYQQIEDVLASFPDSRPEPDASTPRMTVSAMPRTTPSAESLAQPP